MLPAHPSVTGGLFCDTAPLIVSNGQVWDGLFCIDGAVIEPPVVGGGGGSAIGTHFNQAPDTREHRRPLLLAQALQEDEEMIVLLKALAEVVTWH